MQLDFTNHDYFTMIYPNGRTDCAALAPLPIKLRAYKPEADVGCQGLLVDRSFADRLVMSSYTSPSLGGL